MSDSQREQYKADHQAAEGLAEVEVTLPVQPLRRLQVMWEGGANFGVLEVTALIRDLFGGQDGHLYVLDEALGCPESRL